MKTLFYSTHPFEQSFIEKAADPSISITFTAEALNESTVQLAQGFESIAVFTADNVNAEILEKLAKCGVRFIALRSVGFDHVDIKKACELNIKVANVPRYSPYSVAEHSVMLLLTLIRKLSIGQALMEKNDFRLDQLIGFDLKGKTIGIIGTGAIGEVMAKIMHGFGCNILGYDVKENQALKVATGITYTSLENVCKTSDVISIHCPLNDVTHHLFNATLFKQLKKGVYIINTARGGIINTADLLAALQLGIVGAVGLDVYEHEKAIFFENHQDSILTDQLFNNLRKLPNVLITGHQAFLTSEALQNIAETTLDNLVNWSKKGAAKNELIDS